MLFLNQTLDGHEDAAASTAVCSESVRAPPTGSRLMVDTLLAGATSSLVVALKVSPPLPGKGGAPSPAFLFLAAFW